MTLGLKLCGSMTKNMFMTEYILNTR